MKGPKKEPGNIFCIDGDMVEDFNTIGYVHVVSFHSWRRKFRHSSTTVLRTMAPSHVVEGIKKLVHQECHHLHICDYTPRPT
jgi:hypothetical protein